MSDVVRLLGRGTSPESSRLLRSVTVSQDRRRLERIQQLVQSSRLWRFIDRSLLRLGGAWGYAAIIRVVRSQKDRLLALDPARRSRLVGWMLFVIVLTHFYLSIDPAREARTHPVILGRSACSLRCAHVCWRCSDEGLGESERQAPVQFVTWRFLSDTIFRVIP